MDIEAFGRKIYKKYKARKANKNKAPKTIETRHNERFDYQVVSSKKGGYIVLTGVRTNETELKIPKQIEGKPIEVIGANLFANRTDLVSVEMPMGIKEIGDNAFKGCTALTEIELAADIEKIGASAFEGCVNLKKAMLPYNLVKIGAKAFKGCVALEDTSHYMRTGISAAMTLDKSLIEENLPSGLEYIGENAFENCKLIKRVYVPYGVETLADAAFKGCESLTNVYLHNNLKKMGNSVFEGCEALTKVRIPSSVKAAGQKCFASGVELVCDAETPQSVTKALDNGSLRVLSNDYTSPTSLMNPQNTDAFYSETELEEAIERHELRSPVKDLVTHESFEGTIAPARFDLEEDLYVSQGEKSQKATIMLTGDLMCREMQIKAYSSSDTEGFDGAFNQVRDLLAQSDFAVGNMESMVAPSAPYCSESAFVDDRPHLNAPMDFLAAVRNAGFDAVVNAQNHIYDTGTRGIYETLDSLNKCHLMHTGVFAGVNDKRYIMAEVNGIKVAIVAYLDQARQKMKRANFTKSALNDLFSTFQKNQIVKDISDAKAEGAEFVIAYCHWGREYTREITDRQERFAKAIANAGADFIFGSHSHCIQPYTLVKTNDNREVPVIYSGGNFLSNMSLHMPFSRDTFIAQLNLERNADGEVVLVSHGFHPCVIRKNGAVMGNVHTVSLSTDFAQASVDKQVEYEAAILRIRDVLGYDNNFECYVDDACNPLKKLGLTEDVMKAAPEMPADRIKAADLVAIKTDGYTLDEQANAYVRQTDTSVREARIMCAGTITFDKALSGFVSSKGQEGLKNSLRGIGNVLIESDYAIATFDKSFTHSGDTAARAFASGLGKAGFTSFACETSAAKQDFEQLGLLALCADETNDILTVINDIKVGIVVMDASHHDANRVAQLLDAGAEFIVVYVLGTLSSFDELIEAGAGAIVCSGGSSIGKRKELATSEGRRVPVYTGLGNFYNTSVSTSVMADLIIRKSFDGTIEFEDVFIPFKYFKDYHEAQYALEAASTYFNKNYKQAMFRGVRSSISEKLSGDAKIHPTRVVKMSQGYQPCFTPEELYKLFGATPTEKDLKNLGSKYTKPLTCIVTRKPDLKKGCCAIPRSYAGNYQRDKVQLDLNNIIEGGAVLVIDRVPHDEIATIVVDTTLDAAFGKIAEDIVARRHPFTVGVTGTVGKTTTKEMCAKVFENYCQTFSIHGNNNTIFTIRQVVQKLQDSDGAYIQEVHGGNPGSAHNISMLIKPDVAMITSIGKGHLGQMGTMERVIEGKMQIADGLREDGVLVVNDDNEYLHEEHPEGVKVIRYSASNPECDYYAQNITSDGLATTFQIVSRGGEFDEPGVYDARLNVQGIHNVTNAVGVFAAARKDGVPPHRIVAGLAHFRTEGFRQNLVTVGDNKLLIDVYSTTPLSAISAVQTLSTIPIPEGAKRIAVVSDIPDQGADTVKNHYEVGEKIAEYDFDILFCGCSDSKYIVQACREKGKEAYFFGDTKTLQEVLSRVIGPGDAVLFKSGTRIHFKEDVVVPMFGTSWMDE